MILCNLYDIIQVLVNKKKTYKHKYFSSVTFSNNKISNQLYHHINLIIMKDGRSTPKIIILIRQSYLEKYVHWQLQPILNEFVFKTVPFVICWFSFEMVQTETTKCAHEGVFCKLKIWIKLWKCNLAIMCCIQHTACYIGACCNGTQLYLISYSTGSVKIWRNVYRSDVQITLRLNGHFKGLLVLYSK